MGAQTKRSWWRNFLDIRDLRGIVQVVFNPDLKEIFDTADSCRSEYVVNIKGLVKRELREP